MCLYQITPSIYFRYNVHKNIYNSYLAILFPSIIRTDFYYYEIKYFYIKLTLLNISNRILRLSYMIPRFMNQWNNK